MGPHKQFFKLKIEKILLSISFLGAQKKCFIAMILLSTHNMFWLIIKKYNFQLSLSHTEHSWAHGSNTLYTFSPAHRILVLFLLSA